MSFRTDIYESRVARLATQLLAPSDQEFDTLTLLLLGLEKIHKKSAAAEIVITMTVMESDAMMLDQKANYM